MGEVVYEEVELARTDNRQQARLREAWARLTAVCNAQPNLASKAQITRSRKLVYSLSIAAVLNRNSIIMMAHSEIRRRSA